MNDIWNVTYKLAVILLACVVLVFTAKVGYGFFGAAFACILWLSLYGGRMCTNDRVCSALVVMLFLALAVKF
jgi:hypothetical protein